MSLTVAYLTNRQEPLIEWFFQSLALQVGAEVPPHVIVVDFYAEQEGRRQKFDEMASKYLLHIQHVEPKPNVWSGRFRLPADNWFSAANSRNTALCLCKTDWLAYVDDLSILMPGWLNCVKDAMRVGYVALGSYRKAFGMVVENGLLKSFDRESVDTRLKQVTQDVTPCDGGWLYGCSLAGPVEDFLKVGGWPQDLCDGLGSEDCVMGKAMRNAGVDLRYDRRMITVESEEGHGQPGGFKKADKGPAGTESDKSHRALRTGEKTTYFYNVCDIPKLRRDILSGGSFPVTDIGPNFDWFDGQPISEFK